MCYTCGCNLPYDDHGDPDNITEVRFEESAMTEEMQGEDKVKAKQNMLDLLLKEKQAGELEKPREEYSKGLADE